MFFINLVSAIKFDIDSIPTVKFPDFDVIGYGVGNYSNKPSAKLSKTQGIFSNNYNKVVDRSNYDCYEFPTQLPEYSYNYPTNRYPTQLPECSSCNCSEKPVCDLRLGNVDVPVLNCYNNTIIATKKIEGIDFDTFVKHFTVKAEFGYTQGPGQKHVYKVFNRDVIVVKNPLYDDKRVVDFVTYHSDDVKDYNLIIHKVYRNGFPTNALYTAAYIFNPSTRTFTPYSVE